MIVIASGGFDPLHVGHLTYLQCARQLGDKLWVIVNSDEFLVRKKGYVFMPFYDRVRIVGALSCVDAVFGSEDTDQTVCETLRWLRGKTAEELLFANGGDRSSSDSPERPVCEELGIRMVDGLGAKVRSSSELVQRSLQCSRPSTPCSPAAAASGPPFAAGTC